MAESKQKSTTKARPAAKAPGKAPQKAAKTSSGTIKAPSAGKTSSGTIKAPSTGKTSSGTVKAVARKPAPKARAKAGDAPAQASHTAAPARKPKSKPRAPVIDVEPVLVPDAVLVPQQLSMAPLVDATLVEETVVELPKEPQVAAAAEPVVVTPVETARTHHETMHRENPQELPVDGWAAQTIEAAQRTVLDAIRAVVRRVAPRALESGFLRDAQVVEAREILEGASERVRQLRTRIGEQLPLEVIERFLRDAVKKNDGRTSRRAR